MDERGRGLLSQAGMTPQPITLRERAVIELLRAGMAKKQIARALGISTGCVSYRLALARLKSGACCDRCLMIKITQLPEAV
jgi:DNA-binding NarL/FixJ family response regulator